ncbi:histidine phosphatase family protein [Psychrobacter sp. CAL346-MNA-CIBAN-0220]|uniref:histidine phosphatase family protein n=1 Tax=Psychrobacter sp. CAL346-MNA-CIBAN-0220 TaxID=3140457 RepID=UPI00332B5F4E
MTLYIWRHPKPLAATGICLGHTDMGVDKRKLKRLANQIQRFARRHQLLKVIWVSPLKRSLKVGQILAQHGFQCHISSELAEIDFGVWDGCPWETIAKQEIDKWCDDFAHFAPDNGESLQQLFVRVEGWLNERIAEQGGISINMPILVVGHAGWINAAKMIDAGQDVPRVAADWRRSVAYGERSTLRFQDFDWIR